MTPQFNPLAIVCYGINMYYNTSGYQTSININSKGCDSIHVLDLTIYHQIKKLILIYHVIA